MKLGWLLFQYAPADLTLSRGERAEVRRRTWHAYRTTPSSLIISLITATCLGVLFAAVMFLLDQKLLGNMYFIVLFAAPLVLIAITWIVNAFVGRWLYGKAQRHALREMGYEVCLACGYYLRGLSDDVQQCPECGAARESLKQGGHPAH